MTCPHCGNLVTGEPVTLNLTICPTCLASLVLMDGAARRATAHDTTQLADSDLTKLRKARKALREAA